MNIYVKSRGVSKGYSWLDENQNEISNPPNLESKIQLVDSDYFSVILYREGQLSLLVTGLESSQRTDNRTRKIRNSVLWVGEKEATLRAIAIQALEGKLAGNIDEAVTSENNPQGFKVDFSKLGFNNFINKSLSQDNNPEQNSKIGKLSKSKNDLIDELKKYSLPNKEGILVIVSSTISKASLEQNKVWRGLSESETIPDDDDWIEYNAANNFEKKNSPEWLSMLKNYLFPIVAVALVISLGVNVWLVNELKKIPYREKKIKELEQTIQKQESKKQKLENDLLSLNKEIDDKKIERDNYKKLDSDLKQVSQESYQNLKKDLQSFQSDLETLRRELQRIQENYPQLN
ncbi:hypothetical protein VB834_02220 [Limnoraphis robusta Tam1]|uniref:hypothetical protein n=1 Tax=Limnoraphis robusta TaxID=1118279 RepID=UPI002B205249|nr:hypothetical protein [Limnoraphis robusta]MEA5537840.1 hypothetical protein [Limnoraphis robusta Tam1]